MKKETIILLLVIVVFILLMTGVGYAVEVDETLIISDNTRLLSEQADFNIEFTGKPTYTGEGAAILTLTGPTSATLDITELNSVGDSVTAVFTIRNNSNDIYADIYTKTKNTNTEYFKVTSTLSKNRITPKKGTATLQVTVELIKTPLNKEEKTDICANIFASPVNFN